MIKNFKLYILLAAVACSATSCLDKMPEDAIPFDDAIKTVDDVNLAVVGIYDAFKTSALYSGNLTGKTFWLPIQALRLCMPDCTL